MDVASNNRFGGRTALPSGGRPFLGASLFCIMFPMCKKFIEIPHISLPGVVYFVTTATYERFVLPPEARMIVLNCIRHFSDERYKLYAAVVMPDHIHALFQPLKKDDGEYVKLSSVMNVMKGYSSHKVKQLLGRDEPVWQRRYIDQIVRNERHLSKCWEYLLMNPVKANLVSKWLDYPYVWTNAMD